LLILISQITDFNFTNRWF